MVYSGFSFFFFFNNERLVFSLSFLSFFILLFLVSFYSCLVLSIKTYKKYLKVSVILFLNVALRVYFKLTDAPYRMNLIQVHRICSFWEMASHDVSFKRWFTTSGCIDWMLSKHYENPSKTKNRECQCKDYNSPQICRMSDKKKPIIKRKKKIKI